MDIDNKPRANGWHTNSTQSMLQNGHSGISGSPGSDGRVNGVSLKDSLSANERLQNGSSWANAVASTSKQTLDSMYHDVKPDIKPLPLPAGKIEDSQSRSLAAPADVDRFLAFDLEEDKKPQVKDRSTNRGKSRSNSPQTPDLNDDSDVDDSAHSPGKPKPTLRKPGAPMSIAHLAIAEKAVSSDVCKSVTNLD